MNIYTKLLASAAMAFTLFVSQTVLAEEAVSAPAGNISEVVSNLEKALVDVNNSSFSEARLHIKTARTAAETLTGDKAKIDSAMSNVVQGQIQANKGNVKESADLISKALTIFKSL